MRLAVAMALLVATAAVARADGFLKSSPGELTTSHASLDDQDKCDSCHEPDNSISANKCLGCHDHQDLKARIDAGNGFHASAKVKGRDCKLCHQEHRGRSFDLTGWRSVGGQQGFDHALTGWPLAGKHAATDCAKCHKTVDKQGLRTFLGTERTCGGCHDKDSHHGALRKSLERCDRCHTEAKWQPPKPKLDFDHDAKTDAAMPLDGAHADVPCSKCHPKAQFKLVSYKDGDCATCHKSPHDGTLFATKACGTCHQPALRSLREVRFDHKKETGYPLLAKHADLACDTCHTKSLGKRKPTPACESCHAKDDKHQGRFSAFGSPPACSTCHSQREWKKDFQFNHGTKTRFDLTGKHARTACRSCHRGSSPSQFEKFDITKGCMSCHRHQNAHGGKFQANQCLQCHEEGGSKRMRADSLETFHGEQSKFPLRGGHTGVQCQMCHVNDVYQDTPRECGDSCHQDALHKGTLGKECSRCHEPGDWAAKRFDHATQTKWPLEGKHQAVQACASCHPGRAFHQTPTTCGAAGCHAKDDVHQGKLGAACEKCHRTDGATTFRHDRDSRFRLDGAHAQTACGKCHASIAYKPVPLDCAGCHPEPAVHKGRYGTACERCHTTKTFADIKALHDVGDFSLTGAHDNLTCKRCHERGENRRGSGNLCVTCHQKDDVHQNALSPRCGECHTQQAFTPARFDHASTGCNLSGQHATLPCAQCHTAGNYGAVSPLCVSCHRTDAQRVRTPDHTTLFECGRCHNPTAWVPAMQLGEQSVCR